MNPNNIVTYDYFGSLYINMTNRCDCRCVFCIRDQEASALGACMIAMTGAGECAGFEEAQKICCGEAEYYSPENTDAFTDRFTLYTRLYPILKDEFQALRSVKKQ